MIEGTRPLYPAEAVAAARIACINSIDRIRLIPEALNKKEERGPLSISGGDLNGPFRGEI
jgi:hypothetical protein